MVVNCRSIHGRPMKLQTDNQLALQPDRSIGKFRWGIRSGARGLFCAIGLLLVAACATPVSVERLGDRAGYRELNVNVLTADQLSQSTRIVLRRWVLSEQYDSDPQKAIAALQAIVVDGRGGEEELF